jgi:hypothetical protein
VLTVLLAYSHRVPFPLQSLPPDTVHRWYTPWQEARQREPLRFGLASDAWWTWNHHFFCAYTFGMSGRTFIGHLPISFQIFFPRSVAKEAGYKAKTISIRSGVQNTVLDSPTSTTWGATANQDYDTPASVPSPYGRNAQPEALSPQQHRILLNQSMPMRPLAPGHGGVGSGPAAWDEDKHPGDIEAGIHDPEAYIKMESRPYLGDDKTGGPTVKLGVPKRPQRPGTQVLNPLVSSIC